MLFNLFTHWRNAYSGLPRAIWLLALVNLINRCGGMVIVFMTIYLHQNLHFSLTQTGVVMGWFGAGALAGMYIGGKLTDRIGYYPVQIWSLVLNGLALIGLLWVRDFYLMCAAIFVLSLVSDLFRPANSVAIAGYSSPENRTRSISLMRMAFNLGWSVAPALGGIIAYTLGWEWLFWIDGLTCIAAAFALRWLLKPVKTMVKSVGTPEIEDNAMPSAYRNTNFIAFAVFTFLGAMVFMQFIWTVPLFLQSTYHWDERVIGLVVAINGVIVFLVEMPLIFQIEGKRPALQFVQLGLILYALSYAGFMLPGISGFIAATLFIALISFGEIMVMPFSSNYVYGMAMESSKSGDYMALYGMAYSVANILAPLVSTQIISASGYPMLWWLLIGLSAMALFGFRWLEKGGVHANF
jgi:predicted MFS family arabinose efflux permease